MTDVTEIKLEEQQPGEVKDDAGGAPIEPKLEAAVAANNFEREEKMPAEIDKLDDASANIVSKDEKLDELSSLEQEIAKLHNIDSLESEPKEGAAHELVAAMTASRSSSAGENGAKEINPGVEHLQSQYSDLDHDSDLHLQQTEGQTTQSTLEEVDLIALLKGTDTNSDQPEDTSLPATDNVGVTIEGEGQYEIMEIDDDDQSAEVQVPTISGNRKGATIRSHSRIQTKPLGKTKLTPEEARAVALEQIADLKSQGARRKEAAVKNQDIVTSLNDDWNEYDSGGDSTYNIVAKIGNKKGTTIKKIKTSSTETSHADVKPVVTNIVKLKSVAIQKHGTAAISGLDKAQSSGASALKLNESATSAVVAETTGFKRTRVVKPKIIWDPDVPETQKSYSQYASPKTAASSPIPAAKIIRATPNLQNATSVTVSVKKEPAQKKPRSVTPKDLQPAKTQAKRIGTPSKIEVPTQKRHSQTSNANAAVPNGGNVAKKKKISEIDRLMGDEGAANMIQAVEHEQRELGGTLDSGDTVNKPLMRKRALTITGRPARSGEVEAANGGKKESTSSPPKSGKRTAALDAVFAKAIAPTTSPASDSWDFVYKQRASEESMIMRRRSNSSYSSNASVSRLSIDNKPNANLSDDATEPQELPFKFLKPETKSNQRSGGATTAQTLANDLKRSVNSKDSKANAGNITKSELVVVRKLEKVAQLIINTQGAKLSYTYNTQLLQKLSDTLNKLAKSQEYNTVLICTQDQPFCHGIDVQEVVASALEKRRNSANQLAAASSAYIKALATFPKPVVAAVTGNIKNLGVMQLPLFDYVVVADDCCLEANYAMLGHIPEAYAFWFRNPKVPESLHKRLFLLGESLHISDVIEQPNGLIDSVTKPSNVNDEALEVAKLISTTTAENYGVLKKGNQLPIYTDAFSRMEKEFKIIVDQWTSPNCQASIKRYIHNVDI